MKHLFLVFICLTGFATFAQKEFNNLDEKGNKHGLWKGFYEESQRPRYEGTFEHGKEIGKFTYYDDTKSKSIIATREFNAKDNTAYTIFYDQLKNKVSEGKIVKKDHEGPWKYYHKASTTVMTLENYKNGKLDGLRSVYFPDGKITEEINYKNGIKEGIYKKYTLDGVAIEETNYSNGEFDGLAIFRAPDGNVVAKGQFKKGKKVGIWEFYENGKLASKDNYNNQRKKFEKKKVVRPEPE